jgi:hypothetical protein
MAHIQHRGTILEKYRLSLSNSNSRKIQCCSAIQFVINKGSSGEGKILTKEFFFSELKGSIVNKILIGLGGIRDEDFNARA